MGLIICQIDLVKRFKIVTLMRLHNKTVQTLPKEGREGVKYNLCLSKLEMIKRNTFRLYFIFTLWLLFNYNSSIINAQNAGDIKLF